MAVGDPFRFAFDLKLNRAAQARTDECRHPNDLRVESEIIAQTIAACSAGFQLSAQRRRAMAIRGPIPARLRVSREKGYPTMSFKAFSIQLHKWAALVVGIQLFLWVSGGLVMSLSDIDEVHGDLTKATMEPKPLRWGRVVAVDAIVSRISAPIVEISLSTGFFGPQYRLTDMAGVVHHFDAQTGEPLSAIDANQAVEIAVANYLGDETSQTALLVDQNSTEYQGRLPAWRVDFDDEAATTLYIAADNGDVVTRRNRIWRIYDFAWMLHIMDYRERTDFNHPLLVWASALALLVALSGVYLIGVTSWRREARRLMNHD
jgi:hypothetical protein